MGEAGGVVVGALEDTNMGRRGGEVQGPRTGVPGKVRVLQNDEREAPDSEDFEEAMIDADMRAMYPSDEDY